MSTEKSRTSHDHLFKELLHRFFAAFLHTFFPNIAAQLNFATLRFIERELVINFPQQMARIPDVVAEISTLTGEIKTIIIHFEIENRKISTLPARLFEYYALLRTVLQRDVLSIAFYPRHNAGGVGWKEYKIELFGETLVRFRYPQVGLRGLTSETYLSDQPLAAALALLMKPENQPLGVVKLQALKTVVGSDLTGGDKLFLIKLMETYVPTRTLTDASEVIMQELATLETTWVDEALAQGLEQGRKAALEKALHRLLTRKFGELPPALSTTLQAQPFPVLDRLFDEALDAESLVEFSAKLEQIVEDDKVTDE